MNNFYVYVLLDPRNPGRFQYGRYVFNKCQPFYVGKGKGARLRVTKTIRGTSSPRNFKLRTINRIRDAGLEVQERVFRGLTEEEAFALETRLIKAIGRRDLKTGPLTNLTNGGDGTSGWTPSKAQRARMKAARARQIQTPEMIAKRAASNTGKKRTEDTKALLSLVQIGKTLSAEHREKISKANKGKTMSPERRQLIRDSMAAARARGVRIGGRNQHNT